MSFARRAFTLAEVLVAVAAIALLSVGVGQLFRSISGLVSVGSATAEVDQLARAFEKQLRDDIAAFNSMSPEKTFLAIRMREVGDVNHNAVFDGYSEQEVPVYLTQDDADADLRDTRDTIIAGPYAEGSRAVTRRVDELMFLGYVGDASYTTYQADGVRGKGGATSQVARLYYGHGLRAAPDPDWPPIDPDHPAAPRAPRRFYVPDGDFGSPPTDPAALGDTLNRFDPDRAVQNGFVAGRNRFAGGWSLVRQPLLLYGGTAAGYPGAGASQTPAPIGDGREFAPFARDIDTVQRIRFAPMDYPSLIEDQDLVLNGLVNEDRPDYRLIQDGRVDICAQSADDLRRFLEGRDPNDITTGAPLTGGRLADPNLADEDPALVNAPLWVRRGGTTPVPADDVSNLQSVQLAIAGMFSRLLVEPSPPVIDRAPPLISSGQPAVDPEDALMDVHALIASRCSNFEIAWSDGATALTDIDFENDGVFELGRGDIIWYDLTPLDLRSGAPIRSTRANWSGVSNTYLNLDPLDPLEDPEITQQDWGSDAFRAPLVHDGLDLGAADPTGSSPILYAPDVCGGSPDLTFASEDAREQLVIFPFRSAQGGGWGGAFPKHILLRVRMTLHDAQGRLPRGKSYEFILDIDPEGF